MKHDLLPTEFISVSTLQMKDPVGVSMDLGETRFRKTLNGAQFANTMFNGTTFKIDPFRKVKPPMLEE